MVNKVNYRRQGKLATVKDSKTDVSNFSPSAMDSDEGLGLETSVFESFKVDNLPYRYIDLVIDNLHYRSSTQFLSKLNPLTIFLPSYDS